MECLICLVPDPGNHGKESCCRACAAFFRRTVQLKLRYKCKRIGNCSLTKENRYYCKYCRMKRCIATGMTSAEDPSSSLDFYLDDSPAILPRGSKTLCDNLLPSLGEEELFTEENVFPNFEKFLHQYQEKLIEVLSKSPSKLKLPFELSIYQQAHLAYETHRKKWPNCAKGKVFSTEAIDLGVSLCLTLKEVVHIAEFCMELDLFSKFPLDQKMSLLEHFTSRFIYLERALVSSKILGADIEDTRTVWFNGQVGDIGKTKLDTSKLSHFKEQDIINLFLDGHGIFQCHFSQFKKLNPDDFEFVYMLVTTLLDVKGVHGISTETISVAELMQERLNDELLYYYKFEKKLGNYASRIYKMKNIFASFDKLDILRREHSEMAKTFEIFNFYGCFGDWFSLKDN